LNTVRTISHAYSRIWVGRLLHARVSIDVSWVLGIFIALVRLSGLLDAGTASPLPNVMHRAILVGLHLYGVAEVASVNVPCPRASAALTSSQNICLMTQAPFLSLRRALPSSAPPPRWFRRRFRGRSCTGLTCTFQQHPPLLWPYPTLSPEPDPNPLQR